MSNDVEFTASDVIEMIKHWLATPINNYIGSDYGSDVKSLLFQPLNTIVVNEFLEKLKSDIPLISVFDNVNLVSVPIAHDKLSIFLLVDSVTIDIGEVDSLMGSI